MDIQLLFVIKGVRVQLSGHAAAYNALNMEQQLQKEIDFVNELKSMDIAVATKEANG